MVPLRDAIASFLKWHIANSRVVSVSSRSCIRSTLTCPRHFPYVTYYIGVALLLFKTIDCGLRNLHLSMTPS